MLATVLNTAHLPPADRLAAWVEITGLALVGTHLRFHEPDGQASIQTMPLGAAQLSVMSYTALSSQRTPRLIRQSDPELYQLALITSGQQTIEQARQHAPLSAGDLVVYDSSRPFHASVEPDSPCGARSLLLQFPRSQLPLPDTAVAALCGTPLSGQSGIGKLLGHLLTGLAETHADITPADCIRLGNTAVDLTAALLAHQAGRQATLSPESRQRALFAQIISFITAHLHDPHLNPDAVAAAHFISTRYLHRIFQQHGTTVSALLVSDHEIPQVGRVPRHVIPHPRSHVIPQGDRGWRGS